MAFSRDHLVFSATNADWDGRPTRVFGGAAARTDTWSFARRIELGPAAS